MIGTYERRAPYSEDAEQAVLAATLLEPQALTTILPLIDAGSFYAERHRKLFGAMVTLAERGTTIDPLTLSSLLHDRGELESSGGKDYIGFLVDAVPTAANIRYHAEIVREKAQLRRIIEAAGEMQAAAFTGEDSAAVIAQSGAEALLPVSVEASDVAGFVSLKDLLWPEIMRIEARAQGEIHGLRTGYTSVDDGTGGFQGGELVIIGAVEGHGKSALALNIALRVASAAPAEGGGAGAYVSAEMSKEQLTQRAIAWAGRVDAKKLRTGQLINDDFSRVARGAGVLSTVPLWIDDEPEPSLSDVTARCVHLKATHPELRLIVVDFLQLVRVRGNEAKRHEQLTAIAYALKGLAKRLGVVLIAPCQVNSKEVEDGKDAKPQLKDLQGASGMRQAADFVALMYRPAVYDPMHDPRMLEVHFAKCRQAAPFVAHLDWDDATLSIENARSTRLVK